ncbi:ElyC/SanA/YdcF family protein [Pontiellaceae bacterium B1224]|nr:ElyC/SanA/YdcF family protein [Pontiellaceae bacterium B1224]
MLLGLALAAVISIPVSNHWIRRDSQHTVYTDAGRIPPRNVGLVLGCAKNIYFYHRIDAAATLYKANKIKYILVSGDNHTATYDETTAMKAALIQRGVPANRIICDYAGFSTIDSIIRARKVFGQSRITIISQEFHVQRALFIAKRKHIDAIGYCALDVETSIGARTQLREAFARVKTVLDLYLLHRRPRFLGKPVLIGTQNQSSPSPS